MPRRVDKTAWVKEKSTLQIQWITEYLSARGKFRTSPGGFYQSPYQRACKSLEDINANTDEGKMFFKRIKAAWSKHQMDARNKRNGKKTHNIVMRKSIIKDLKLVAEHRKTPINETLEYLITTAAKNVRELYAK